MKGNGNPYGMYFLTGSESIKLIKNAEESLAGRVALLEMNTLSNSEIYNYDSNEFIPNINKLNREYVSFDDNTLYQRIFTGGYPELYKNKNIDRDIFFESYIDTYIEKDVTEIINIQNKMLFRKFLRIIAARTACELIYENIAQDVGVDLTTIKR
jgi:predicted AAA+ superfamily ATPase